MCWRAAICDSAVRTERLADLHAIGTGPARELTLAVRGGYGLGRLLDRIEFARIAEQAAQAARRSSVTAISPRSSWPIWPRLAGVSFAGPMLLADFGEEHVDSFMWRHFEGILRAPVHDIEVEAPQVAAPATVEGTLWGGNLAMLCTLLGTPYMPNIDGGILFLEDINEPPYRVERMLLQLLQAGVLARNRPSCWAISRITAPPTTTTATTWMPYSTMCANSCVFRC
jgi:muramoyltetrapeptide carboxypeptidase